MLSVFVFCSAERTASAALLAWRMGSEEQYTGILVEKMLNLFCGPTEHLEASPAT